jgi:hypothetical protein
MSDKLTAENGGGVGSGVWLADMQRCLLWMEHENRCAEREEKMGHWLSDHSGAMRHWDEEFLKARDAYLSANNQAAASGARGRSIANSGAPAALPPAHGWASTL